VENSVLFDRRNWPPHRPWLILFLLGTIGSFAWFWTAAQQIGDWPGGRSMPGFTFGVVGGLIILFELALWFRKKVRVWRIGRAQTWLRAHIWLGLLCLPLLILHSGLRLGGVLSTTLMVLLVIVIVSGIWGLILQNMLPKKMLEEIPAETIYSQMDYLSGQLLAEAERLVAATCGSLNENLAGVSTTEAAQNDVGFVVVGKVRSAGSVQGKVLDTRVPAAPILDAEPLARFFHEHVAPFLRRGSAGNPELANAGRAAVLFQNIKTQIPPAAHEVVNALEDFCLQRRQWDVQARWHFWLHSWLWVHFPLSVALVVLMAVHVYVSLKYG
jgi:hypothetical protein